MLRLCNRPLVTAYKAHQQRWFAASSFVITQDNNLDNLITDIKSVLKGVKTKEDVDIRTTLNLLRYYISKEDQWSKYSHRAPGADYTRNKVLDISDNAKLLVMVWEPGKSSKIHNHPQSNCFMKILKGSLEERLFTKSDDDEPLVLKRYTTLPVDSVAYISDNIGLHQMVNPTKELAVSLHLYVPSYNQSSVFHKNGNRINDRAEEYYSIGGELISK